MVLKIQGEINTYIIEFGSEGRLISMQLEELVANLNEETLLLIKDYGRGSIEPEKVFNEINQLAQEEVLPLGTIVRLLGYQEVLIYRKKESLPEGIVC